MKTLHINVDATTHRAAQNMAALLNMEPDRLLSHVVTKLAPILDKSDSEAAAALSVHGAIIARAKSEHARVKLTLPWGAWQQLSDYCQYLEESPANLAALLAAMLPAAMLDALQLTSADYRRQGANFPSIFNKISKH